MSPRPRSSPLRIGTVALVRTGGVERVSAVVDGAPLWFESADTPLRASPEAFASALLIPGLHRGAALELSEPVDATWLSNVGKLLPVLGRWWRYPALPPRAAGGTVSAPAPPASAPDPAGLEPGVALFFSGGVDSFHLLLRGARRPDRLLTVQGFDVPLGDELRMRAVEATAREVAAALGRKSIVIRTNVREHPAFGPVPWVRSHGGALAAVAHVLGDGVREALIASSVGRHRDTPWGSHRFVDPLFSSARLSLHNLGSELRRVQKLPEIADEPLVRRHLRVCWENREPVGNCSRCSKCVMTRLKLAECGALDAFPVFQGTATLARDVDALPSYRNRLTALAELARSPALPPEVRRATQGLLRRSRHAQHPLVKARRAAWRWVQGVARGRRA